MLNTTRPSISASQLQAAERHLTYARDTINTNMYNTRSYLLTCSVKHDGISTQHKLIHSTIPHMRGALDETVTKMGALIRILKECDAGDNPETQHQAYNAMRSTLIGLDSMVNMSMEAVDHLDNATFGGLRQTDDGGYAREVLPVRTLRALEGRLETLRITACRLSNNLSEATQTHEHVSEHREKHIRLHY